MMKRNREAWQVSASAKHQNSLRMSRVLSLYAEEVEQVDFRGGNRRATYLKEGSLAYVLEG